VGAFGLKSGGTMPPQQENKKGHAQHIAFVLQFGKFCGLNRMFLNGFASILRAVQIANQ
jgi:hypothetical protein